MPKLGAECIRLERKRHVLKADQRIFELDLKAHREAVIREQRGARALAGDFHRLQHLDRAPWQVLPDGAGLVDQRQERSGAAVHRRHFVAVELDDRVVDAAAGQRRHQMLDGLDLDAFAIRKNGAQRGVDGVGPQRLDLGARVDPVEDDAGARRRGPQRHRDVRAAMKPDTAACRRLC
jgi:hypothetical protein